MGQRVAADWTGDDVSEMLAVVRGGSLDDRRSAARGFDWAAGDLNRLGWMMSQKDIDLGTAARVFLNGDPIRFQHMHKRDISDADRKRCNLLDAIHKRLVAGFYLPDPESGLGDERAAMMRWIADQDTDRANGRRGRWNFTPALFEPLTLASVLPDSPGQLSASIDKDIFAVPERPKRVSLLRELFSSITG